MDLIEKALGSYNCPYCGHTAKSPSGRTLHRKSCKEERPNVALQKKYKIGKVVTWKGKSVKIKLLRDGLVALEDGQVVACSKLKDAEEIETAPALTYRIPRTVLEWADGYIKRYQNQMGNTELRKYISRLFRLCSGYTTFTKWTDAQLQEALDRRLPCQPKSSNSSAAKMLSAPSKTIQIRK